MADQTNKDRADLVTRLRALAGMIMEDASADAVLGGPNDGAEQLRTIRNAAEDAAALIRAAEIVFVRSATV